jgi:transcription antitermination factor NusA-like protein
LVIHLPICNFDAKTGILCPKCESKLRNGEITAADVEASKALIHVAERIPDANKVALKRSFEIAGNYVLEFEEQDMQALRSSDAIRTELEGLLKGKVWLTSAGGTERKFLEDMLFPVRVLTVNTVWLPDGEKRTKVIVPGRRSERALGDFEKLRAMVKKVRGIDLVVETEREASYRFD